MPEPRADQPRAAPSWRSAVRLGHAVLRQVVLDPFRDGRLGLRELPAPLRALATVTMVVIGVFLLMMLGAGLWSHLLPSVTTNLDVSYPLGAIQLVAAGMVIAVSLIFVATIHLSSMLRWAGWVVTSLVLTLGSVPMVFFSVGFVVIPLCGSAALLVVMLRQRRRIFHLGELFVTMIVISGCWATTWFFYQIADAGGPTFLVSGMVFNLLPFIAPMACLAGVALAEIAASVATGTIAALHEEAPRFGWSWLLGGLAVAVLVANGLADPSDGEVGWSALMAGACVAGWVGIGVLGRGERSLVPISSYHPEVLWDGFRTTLWTLAVILSLPFLALGVINIASLVLQPFVKPGVSALLASARIEILGPRVTEASILVVALVGVAGAIVQVRRGRTIFARLLWVVAVVAAMMFFDAVRQPLGDGWSVRGLVSVLAVVVLAVGVWLLHVGRLTRTGAMALASALALTLVFPARDVVADPVTALLGTGLASVLLLSAIWQLLTEGAPTRLDSPAFPREARLLFFLGYQLLWVITAAVVVVTRESRFGDIVIAVDLGDRVFGTTLLLVAVLGLLTVALRQPRRSPRWTAPDQPSNSHGAVAQPDAPAYINNKSQVHGQSHGQTRG